MIDLVPLRVALGLSYVFELLMLPLTAWRLTRLRVAARLLTYELSLELQRDLAALREVIQIVQEMEKALATMDLTLTASRQAAARACAIALTNLKRRVAASFPEDAHQGGECDDKEWPG